MTYAVKLPNVKKNRATVGKFYSEFYGQSLWRKWLAIQIHSSFIVFSRHKRKHSPAGLKKIFNVQNQFLHFACDTLRDFISAAHSNY